MPFFTNDWNLKEAYSDPGRAAQQDKRLDNLGNILSDANVGTMAQPGAQTKQSLGAVSGMPPTNYPFYSGASTNMTMGGGFPSIPGMGMPGIPGMLSGGDLGGAYDEMFGPNLSSYESLQAWQNASPMQRSFIGNFNPLGGTQGINLAHGINPLSAGMIPEWLADEIVPEGWQTLPWYEGETDYFGNPMSADDLAASENALATSFCCLV